MVSGMATWREEIKQTLSLGLPMAGAQLSQTLMGTTDVALVGRLEGEALAAMAVGQAAHGLFFAFGIGLVAAVNPLVSQAHGAGNQKAISRTVAVGTCLSFLTAFLCWPLLYRVDLLFQALGYSPAMSELATSYTRALMLGLPFALFFFTQKNYLDSVSQPRFPMLVAITGIFVNAAADVLLMYGHWGFPELGVQGTGLATTVVNIFMALALVLASWKPHFTQALKEQSRTEWIEFVQVGLPIAGSICIEVGLFVTGAMMMGVLGSAEAAAHQIVIVCASTTFMIPLGISFAGSARVGQAIGRGDFQAVRPAGVAAMVVGTAFMSLTCVLFLLIPQTVVQLFWDPSVAKSVSVETFAVELLMIAGIFQVADGLQVTAMGALRGMKDVKVPLLIGGLCYWVIGFGSASYLTFATSLRHQGLWIGFSLGLGAAALAMSARFWHLGSRVREDKQLQTTVAVEAVAKDEKT